MCDCVLLLWTGWLPGIDKSQIYNLREINGRSFKCGVLHILLSELTNWFCYSVLQSYWTIIQYPIASLTYYHLYADLPSLVRNTSTTHIAALLLLTQSHLNTNKWTSFQCYFWQFWDNVSCVLVLFSLLIFVEFFALILWNHIKHISGRISLRFYLKSCKNLFQCLAMIMLKYLSKDAAQYGKSCPGTNSYQSRTNSFQTGLRI